jgi:hypothetical protein
VTACNTGACVVSSSALPTGAATSAAQATIIAGLSSIDGHVDGLEASCSSIDGKITACNTGAVVVSSSALPALAATSTKQSDGSQKTQVVDASGNVQPAGDTVARALFTKTTDGTNVAAVKGASTAAVATDPSMVVQTSPNDPIQTALKPVTGASGNMLAEVSVGTSATQATASNVAAKKGLLIQAPTANTKSVFIGQSSAVSLTNGLELAPGRWIPYAIENANELYAIAADALQKLRVHVL